MADLNGKVRVDISATLTLTEREMRALNALTLYGTDQFLEFFYLNMGKSSLEPHEAGLRSFFQMARVEIPQTIKRGEDARKSANLNEPA